MGSSSAGVYTMAKTSMMDEKNDMATNMATFFCQGSSPEVEFLKQPQTLGQDTWPPENSNLRFFLVY